MGIARKPVKISVIMPVYNAECYLKEAIESVLAQKYTDYELLIVENGSSDQSLLICKEYETKYPSVHVLKEEKKGAGAARNRGLFKAAGEYICFVDADDLLLDNQVLQRLLWKIEKTGADIAVGNYKRLWDGKLLAAAGHEAFSGKAPESEEFRFLGFFSVGTLSYVWGKLYRRAFLMEQGIRFQNYPYAEDKLFNLNCYMRQPKYAFLEDFVYIYRKNTASISFQYRPDSVSYWFHIAEDTDVLIKGQPKYENLPAYILFFAVFFDAKMEYSKKEHSTRAVRGILLQYMDKPFGKKAFHKLAKGIHFKELHSLAWRSMMRLFSMGMVCHFYGMLAFGIKLLIDLRVDERLSDTGLRT